MPSSNAPERAKQSTQRNATDERNERHQDTPKSSHFPDAAKAVDNGYSVAVLDEVVRESSTADTLGHAFCVMCYPSDGDVIVSLCGVLWDGQPIVRGACECAVCETFDSCPSCGVTFHKPWQAQR